jgi:exodeoxyribonuclease V beta subunit
VNTIVRAWKAAAARSNGAIAIAPLPAHPGHPLVSRALPPERLAALAPPHPLPRAWRIGSYSGLAHGAAVEDAARERDALGALGAHGDERLAEDQDAAAGAAEANGAGTLAAAIDGDDILRFPRGPAAGECIHAVFERIDFTDPTGWPAAILAAMRTWRTMRSVRSGSAADASDSADLLAAPGDAARHAAMLHRMVADVLDTPLPVGTPTPLRLATLARERRLVELEFHMGVERLDARALKALLAQAGIAVPALAFPTLRGWLKGFIDLVFEHEGRWFVLDWKSNHLGSTPAAYAGAALGRVMQAQAYHLQSVLYLLALDRLLRARLPAYDPERHLGGAVYLFVRGVRPGWLDAQGRPTGLVLHHPGAQVLHRLSTLFEGAPTPA